MCTEIIDMQMVGIELSRGPGYILSIESHAGAPDNQRVDTEVEWGMAQRVLWSQKVDNELEIRLRLRILLPQSCMGTKELC